VRINGPGQWNGLGESKCSGEVTVQPAVLDVNCSTLGGNNGESDLDFY
jgi:hypothetical protein